MGKAGQLFLLPMAVKKSPDHEDGDQNGGRYDPEWSHFPRRLINLTDEATDTLKKTTIWACWTRCKLGFE